MKRVRIGIIGAGSITEWAILPSLSGPEAVSPPDTGAWWNRRPDAAQATGRQGNQASTTFYSPPAVPEVVALCDADEARATRVARMARVRAVYADARAMLREVELDAVVCAAAPETALSVALMAAEKRLPVWVFGPPATTAAGVAKLAARLEARQSAGTVGVWPARTLARAAAHRAARRLIERGEIGPVTALSLRWASGLPAPEDTSSSAFASCYAAFDWLLECAATGVTNPVAGRTEIATAREGETPPSRVLCGGRDGATTFWMECVNGVTATALFAPAETWNSPLPRLEIVGTRGRFLVCEAGRRVLLHGEAAGGEGARVWEPPGLSSLVSGANVLGIAEDLKAFLAACAAADSSSSLSSSRASAAPFEFTPSMTDTLRPAMRALSLLEAACQSLATRSPVDASGRASAPEPPVAAPGPVVSESVKGDPAPGAARRSARGNPSDDDAPQTLRLQL